jgi:predicted regulator of Ras-like GTPase activity (Roadblock/LC7/MglB family)/ribosomal protein L40E
LIICSNCGATNNEAKGHICRKCGALLPVATKPPRVKIETKKQPVKKDKQASFKPQQKSKEKPSDNFKTQPKSFELQEIPKVKALPNDQEKSKEIIKKTESGENFDDFIEKEESERDILKEITPGPYKGSIIAQKDVYGSFARRKAKSALEKPKFTAKSTVFEEESPIDDSVIRQKQLEQDMSKVLKFLSEKISIKGTSRDKLEKNEEVQVEKESIPPTSMNEILSNLLKIDLNIEASAIIKSEGTILASAISSRISDTLFGVIGQNLSMIGNDIIEGLNAGKLLNISVRGSQGVLDLAPITQDMLLILFSNPRIKSGIIYFAANIVKKQVKQYLGLTD